MRAAFYTLGCKVNQYETAALKQQFFSAGYDIVEPDSAADVYVVNSCTVTASGDQKSRQILRRFKRRNPAAVVALTGCFPQAFPDVATKIPEADVITGSGNRAALVQAVSAAISTGERVIAIVPHKKDTGFEALQPGAWADRTRAFVKIEDGCERYCSYCIIPTARGPVRSKPLKALQQELDELSLLGYREVVLVGINLSCYGSDFGASLLDAVTLACQTPGILRVRLGSLEPELLTDEHIAAMAKLPQFCPQFHLSLQSGCDRTLRRMNRHYDTAEYTRIVQSLRRSFSNCAITTDIMVGFPGETAEEFAESAAFIEEIQLAKAHVFSYSIREGTRAAKMPEQIEPDEKARRSHLMQEAAERARLAFLQKQVGKVEPVLFEVSSVEGVYTGYTPNYTPVTVHSTKSLTREVLSVRITGIGHEGCTGELI